MQLTEGSGDNTFGGFLSPDDQYLYYVKNERRLQRVTLADYSEEPPCIRCRKNGSVTGPGSPTANAPAWWALKSVAKTGRRLSDWTIFQEFYHSNPHCRLLRVDLFSGKSRVIHEKNEWLGHPIYRPL